MESLSVFNDEWFMREAMKEAHKAAELGEVPVGAVVVANQRIIARAHNQVETLGDVTAHAEILAITSAANAIGYKYLHDCTLYVTLEPCPMCAGAIAWSQVDRLLYAASDDKRGFMQYGKSMLHPSTQVGFGLMEKEARELLQSFFQQLR